MKLISLIGARPQIIKEAILNQQLEKEGIEEILVHSGQHYDFNMFDVFFKVLNIKKTSYNLGIGSGTHAEMTGKTTIEFLITPHGDWRKMKDFNSKFLLGKIEKI